MIPQGGPCAHLFRLHHDRQQVGDGRQALSPQHLLQPRRRPYTDTRQDDYTPWAIVKVIIEKSLVPKAPT